MTTLKSYLLSSIIFFIPLHALAIDKIYFYYNGYDAARDACISYIPGYTNCGWHNGISSWVISYAEDENGNSNTNGNEWDGCYGLGLCAEYWIAYFHTSGGSCVNGQTPDETGLCICDNTQRPPDNFDQCVPPVGENLGTTCPLKSGGTNPVNLGIGNKFQIETDFQGSGISPISVVRTFNSLSGKWQFLPEIHETINLYSDEVVRADGKVFTFYSDGNGGWTADADVTGVLEDIDDGQGTIIGWTYTTLDQQVEDYDATGRLVSVTDKSGIAHTYSYTSSDITVTHSASGEELVYSLDGSGRINGFTTPDNETYTYNYDTAGNLSDITYPNGGGTRIYHYEDTNFPNALTGITDANGNRYATWTYDTEGRAISSTHHNGLNDVDTHTIDYTYIDDVTDPRATVTNALGKQTTYHFTTLFGVRKVTQVEGHPSANCAAANKSYTYDSNGFIASKTDWQGNTTTYVRNAKGQELSRTDASGTAEARTITTEWHPDFNVPTKITEPDRETVFTYDTNGNQLSATVTDLSP